MSARCFCEWWRDLRRGYSDADIERAHRAWDASGDAPPGSFHHCTMGELRAMTTHSREWVVLPIRYTENS